MPTFTIATLNAQWCLDRSWRPLDLLSVCRDLDADVVALQEVWRARGDDGVAARVGAELGYEVHEHHHVLGNLDGEPAVVRRATAATGLRGLAVLSRLPSRRLGVVDLGRMVGDAAPRTALVVGVEVDGSAVTVVDVHLTHRPWGSAHQLRRLRRALGRVPAPAVVAGDFNMWGPPVGVALPGWRRTVRGRTWPAHRPHSQIDHLLAGPGVELVGGVVGSDVGSDHRPLRAVLAVHAGVRAAADPGRRAEPAPAPVG